MSRRPARSPTLRKAFQRYARVAYHEAILEAAERVFLRDGYHETKIADVAAESGVSVGTLYNYFASKELIFASIIERGRTHLEQAVAGCAGLPDPVERLRQVLGAALRFIEERGAMFALYTQVGFSGDPDLRLCCAPAGAAYHAHVATLAAIIGEAQEAERLRAELDPEALAMALVGIANSFIYRWLDQGRQGDLPGRADEIFSLFFDGARPR
ncbi:MAG: TetR/AcrR family transcriptional regulator [Sorangiineae bacterium]|nr:TetR/AcrR family transcriptional regulator [Sorangiineae bacterium]